MSKKEIVFSCRLLLFVYTRSGEFSPLIQSDLCAYYDNDTRWEAGSCESP